MTVGNQPAAAEKVANCFLQECFCTDRPEQILPENGEMSPMKGHTAPDHPWHLQDWPLSKMIIGHYTDGGSNIGDNGVMIVTVMTAMLVQ